MLVMRRQIDSYVAWRRAAALAALPDAGRLGVKVKLNPEHFSQWLDAQERWYAHWRDTLKRRFLPCPVLRYEFDIERQPAEAVLRRFAAAAAQLGDHAAPARRGFDRRGAAAAGAQPFGRSFQLARLLPRAVQARAREAGFRLPDPVRLPLRPRRLY